MASDRGGGAWGDCEASDGAVLECLRCDFERNVAIDGGGLWMAHDYGGCTLADSRFAANRARTGAGAALFLAAGLDGVSFDGNAAEVEGGDATCDDDGTTGCAFTP